MDQFTIYCTESQTKRALELGAPIEKLFNHPIDKEICDKYNCFIIDGKCYNNPTSEQMLGWMESQHKINCIDITIDGSIDKWIYVIYCGKEDCITNYNYPTRKEATLAAIDAALKYLTNKK